MRLLLDTHVLLWWLQDNRKLSPAARDRIVAASQVYVSSVSIWEAGIKAAIGKLDIDLAELVTAVAGSGFQELSISHRHAVKVAQLPAIHKDPFDRMLVAQAMCEPLKLLTADHVLAGYSELVEVIGY